MAPTIAIASQNLCFGPTSTAEVTVSSAGGGPTHQYRINNGPLQASPTFSNLVPGNYTIAVVDANNCSSELMVEIPPQLNTSLSIVDEIPCAGDGRMRIRVNGGDISDLSTTSYTIFRNGTAVPGHTGNPLPSVPFEYTVPFGQHGDYTITVTDNNGCTDTSEPITFDQPANILLPTPLWGQIVGIPIVVLWPFSLMRPWGYPLSKSSLGLPEVSAIVRPMMPDSHLPHKIYILVCPLAPTSTS